jgi:hypothetical protein
MVSGITTLGLESTKRLKHLLSVSGFPRSGNTFSGYLSWISYYPSEPKRKSWHTVRAMKEQENVVVPFRNPIDCIASFYIFSNKTTDIKGMANFYKRMYSNAIELSDKVVLVDFEKFTFDTNYFYERVKNKLNIEPVSMVSTSDVKLAMANEGKYNHLPRENQTEKKEVKTYLLDNWDFTELLELYNKLKEC